MTYLTGKLLTLGAMLASVALPTTAQPSAPRIHGFISQAYLHSDGNNIYGNSQSGSTEFMEAGINANWRATERLSLAGQLLSRDAGGSDNGSLRVDYLFADYKAVETAQSGMGLRLGRVRNSYGFYNETRDILFTRPSILMPQAVYFEGNGLREMLFSTDGVQLYSYWDEGEHSTQFNFTYGRNKSLSQDKINTITEGPSVIRKADLETPLYAQLSHSRHGGRSRYALSLVDVSLRAREMRVPTPPVELDASGVVLSAQRNFSRWSFTTEYSHLQVDSHVGAAILQEAKIDAAYLQSRYRFTGSLTATLRFEFSRREDEQSGEQSHSRHWLMGLQWTPAPAWILAADLYAIDGSGGIPAIDNPNATLDQHTQLLAFMLGYRF